MAKFITTIWRGNVGNSNEDVANNLASNLASKDAINQSVRPLVEKRMPRAAIEDCILRLCIIEHSTEEIANVLQKDVRYLRNEIIPPLVQEGKLLPTKQKTDPSQCYITHPKWKIE